LIETIFSIFLCLWKYWKFGGNTSYDIFYGLIPNILKEKKKPKSSNVEQDGKLTKQNKFNESEPMPKRELSARRWF